MATRLASSKLKQSRAAAEIIARETEASVDEVQRIYEEELNVLSTHAKITQYLGVLVNRRVRERLKKH